MNPKRARFVAGCVAAIHFAGAGATALYVAQSNDGQAALTWAYWVFIDFPLSLLLWSLFSDQFFVIHGILGSIWWFCLSLVVITLARRTFRR